MNTANVDTPMGSDKEQAIRKVKLGIKGFVDQVLSRTDDQMDLDIMRRADIVDASMKGTVVIDIELDPKKYANGGGSLHAAAASAIFDDYTCLAFTPLLEDWSVERHNQGPPGGLTKTLNVSYLRIVPLPNKIRVAAEVVSNGKVATFARATMMSPDGKKIYATCEHHKIQIHRPDGGSKGWAAKTAKAKL